MGRLSEEDRGVSFSVLSHVFPYQCLSPSKVRVFHISFVIFINSAIFSKPPNLTIRYKSFPFSPDSPFTSCLIELPPTWYDTNKYDVSIPTDSLRKNAYKPTYFLPSFATSDNLACLHDPGFALAPADVNTPLLHACITTLKRLLSHHSCAHPGGKREGVKGFLLEERFVVRI